MRITRHVLFAVATWLGFVAFCHFANAFVELRWSWVWEWGRLSRVMLVIVGSCMVAVAAFLSFSGFFGEEEK